MQSLLDILLYNSYISRNQYRELSQVPHENIEQLSNFLIKSGYVSAEDWSEALGLIEQAGVLKESERFVNIALNNLDENIAILAEKIATQEEPIIIYGESGTGKAALARFIHCKSKRRNGPFLYIALRQTDQREIFRLLATAQFSSRNEKDQFSGLFFEKGTIFLEDFSFEDSDALDLLMRFYRKGPAFQEYSDQEYPGQESSDATSFDHKNDLFGTGARLILGPRETLNPDHKAYDAFFKNSLPFQINIPPLRNRSANIPQLAQYFQEQIQEQENLQLQSASPGIMGILAAYDWPGNLQELKNCIQRLAILSQNGVMRAGDLPPRILSRLGNSNISDHKMQHESQPLETDSSEPMQKLKDEPPLSTLQDMEIKEIRRALLHEHGNVRRAATLLGIHRNTLTRKATLLGIDPLSYKVSAMKKKSIQQE